MKTVRSMTLLIAVLSLGFVLASSAAAQTCPATTCTLSVSCTTCSIGDTIRFDTNCTVYLREVTCEEDPGFGEPPCQVTCEAVPVRPNTVYYEGERRNSSGVFVPDAACVPGDNPLDYTFVNQTSPPIDDRGTYRRRTCIDSNCSTCSEDKTITVTD